MQVQLRSGALRQPQPLAVVLEGVVGMDAALHADLGRAELDGFGDPRLEVLGADVVGIGRALALAEAAERAPDDADVGEVDVAVDDEGRRLTGQLGPQLVGRHPHPLDHVGALLGEQRGELVLAQWLARAAALDRARGQLRIDRALGAAAGSPARDEAPVPELDQVEHALIDPLGAQVLRIGAEALRERVAAWLEALSHLMRAGEGVLGRDVVAVRRQPAEVGGADLDQVHPPVAEVGRDLDADVRHQAARLGHQALHVLEGDLGGPWRKLLRCSSARCSASHRRVAASSAISATSRP